MTITYSIEELDTVAKQLLNQVTSKTLIFNGDVGAGKTTLIKTLVKALGSKDNVSSPTFSLVNEYEGENSTIYHFDLYRVKDEEELYNIGIETYLDNSSWVFIEWPELIIPFLGEKYNIVNINTVNTNKRTLNLTLR